MHEFTGELINATYPNFDAWGRPVIQIRVNEKTSALQMLDELKNVELTIKLSKRNKKRSLDANAYAWVLIDKIAEKTNATKTDVYRSAIKEVGGNSEIVCIKSEAAEALRDAWKRNGLGWQSDTMPSKLSGCTNVILYYGSSTYSVDQMRRLIDLLCQDCAALGIEVRPQEEIESLLKGWN